MTATTERCPGCHGSGIEMSGVTYAGMSEYVGCHECGPGCPDDCGCRALTERDREAEVEQLRRSRDTWARVEAETRAEMHARLAEHRDAVEVLKLRLSEVAAERDRARSVAVALEAEVERLRAGIEERVVGWSSYRTLTHVSRYA